MAFAPYIDPRQYQPFNPSSDGRVPPPPDTKVPRRRLKATLSNGLMPNAPTIDEDADLLQQDDLAAIEPTPQDHPLAFMDEKDGGIGTDPLLSVGDAAPDAITAPPQAHAAASRGMVPPAPRALPDPFTDDADVNFGTVDFSKVAQSTPAKPRTLFGDVPQAPQTFKIHWGPQDAGRVIQDVDTSAPAGYDYAGQNSAGVDQWSAPPPLDVSDFGHDMAQIRAPRPAPQAYTDPNEFRSDLRDWDLQNKYSMGHIPDYIKMAQGIGDTDTAADLQSVLTGVPKSRFNPLTGEVARDKEIRLANEAKQHDLREKNKNLEDAKKIILKAKADYQAHAPLSSVPPTPQEMADQLKAFDQQISDIAQQQADLARGGEPNLDDNQTVEYIMKKHPEITRETAIQQVIQMKQKQGR